MKRTKLVIGLMLAVILLSAVPAQAEITVKLATLAPEGTVWYRAVRTVADRWSEISGGEVRMKIYPGGVMGNESAIIRKMRIDQLQAVAITSVGLGDIDPSAMVTQSPMLIHSYDELDYIMEQMGPKFEEFLLEKGFVVLNWGDAGWIRFFTKEPMLLPEDAGKFKMFAFEGDPAAIRAYRAVGMQPVVLASTDILPSLQSGLLSGVPAAPLAALSQQWFVAASHMLDMPWAPLLATIIIRRDTWESIPEKYHRPFLQAARDAGFATRSEVRRQDLKAIQVMQKYGLSVHSLPDGAYASWQSAAAKAWPIVREELVGDVIFSEVERHLREYRSAK
jgi:TRAP-type C4-dicarboxylate transport system substrate-binding protein|tara:strand:- start:301 stop:1305 length:1005 start_codon:yes stop_codon:yes gene_type:complete